MPEPSIHLLEANTLGECWLAVSKTILDHGAPACYDNAPILEIANLSMVVRAPDPADEFIRQHGDPAWLAWMHTNFFDYKPVAELGNAASYATRIFNYTAAGRNQLEWVIERLRVNPEARSAAITTFQPLTDTNYIPCISMLDFWRPDARVGSSDGTPVELVVYAHSLDFGKKAYGNLVELASLQRMVAQELNAPLGKLIIHCKSAHIYEPEFAYMRNLTT